MAQRRIRNPFRRYREARGLTNLQLAQALGISESFASKLAVGIKTAVSLTTAKKFERLTNGELPAREVMRWSELNFRPDDARPAA